MAPLVADYTRYGLNQPAIRQSFFPFDFCAFPQKKKELKNA